MQAKGSFKFHGHTNLPEDEGNQSCQMKKLRSTDAFCTVCLFSYFVSFTFSLYYFLQDPISNFHEARLLCTSEGENLSPNVKLEPGVSGNRTVSCDKCDLLHRLPLHIQVAFASHLSKNHYIGFYRRQMVDMYRKRNVQLLTPLYQKVSEKRTVQARNISDLASSRGAL